MEGKLDSVKPGEVFWFITKGSKDNGMPSWAQFPEKERWQIVSYVTTGLSSDGASAKSEPEPAADTSTSKLKARSRPRRLSPISVSKSPAPFIRSPPRICPNPSPQNLSNNGPKLVERPDERMAGQRLPGFKVELYATGLDNPRTLRTAPNGDIFLAEMEPGKILRFPRHGQRRQARAIVHFRQRPEDVPTALRSILREPDPQWIYVGARSEVMRFAYHNGDLKASGRR